MRIMELMLETKYAEAAAKKLRAYREGGAELESRFRAALDQAASAGTAKELAKAFGMSQQYLSDIRQGRRAVSDKVLKTITEKYARS